MVNALIGPITSSAPPHLDFLRRRRRYASLAPGRSRSYAEISAELTMAAASASTAGSARIAVAQMTSVNDFAANFATCSRLVKVHETPSSEVRRPMDEDKILTRKQKAEQKASQQQSPKENDNSRPDRKSSLELQSS